MSSSTYIFFELRFMTTCGHYGPDSLKSKIRSAQCVLIHSAYWGAGGLQHLHCTTCFDYSWTDIHDPCTGTRSYLRYVSTHIGW
ncbi:hypothetical protein XENTR_v10018717 [Xenopus tropicalis]|nr:hypothetical protein XENTR_v10018717 [Xenopus tropicalis]